MDQHREKVVGWGVKTFSERVVAIAMAIPPGRVVTYGMVARAGGAGPMAAQSISAILGKAYRAERHAIPFHRIVYADGRIWMNEHHRKERLKLYKKEGIDVDKQGRIKDFRKVLFVLG